jgi:hypothetical protein
MAQIGHEADQARSGLCIESTKLCVTGTQISPAEGGAVGQLGAEAERQRTERQRQAQRPEGNPTTEQLLERLSHRMLPPRAGSTFSTSTIRQERPNGKYNCAGREGAEEQESKKAGKQEIGGCCSAVLVFCSSDFLPS